jgi:hypothetical protein
VVLRNNLTYLGVRKVVGCALRAGVHYEAVHVKLVKIKVESNNIPHRRASYAGKQATVTKTLITSSLFQPLVTHFGLV